jgi:hypothetical protein
MAYSVCVVPITTGLIAHVGFRLLEPRELSALAALLFGLPTLGLVVAGRSVHYLTAWSLLRITVLHLATLVFATILYRISPFHPLSRYPGPFVCRLSKLWALLIASRGYQHRYYHALHERYGPVVRTGQYSWC